MKVDGGYRPGSRANSGRVREQLEARRASGLSGFKRDWGREVALLLLLVGALVALIALGVAVRSATYERLRPTEHATFWMESAQRYRYVHEVATGRGIPEIDRQMQAPQGYETVSDTLLQEWLYGGLAARRGVTSEALPAFVRGLTRLLASATVVPLFVLAWAICRRRDAALLGAGAVALSLPVVERATGVTLFREELAVPLLLGHWASLALFTRRGSLPWATISAGFLAAALLAWKVVPFLLAGLCVFFLGAALTGRGDPRRLAAAMVIHVVLAAGAAILPGSPLHWSAFLLSGPFQLAGATAVALLVVLLPKAPRWIVPIVALSLCAAARWLWPGERGLDHAWETLFARIRLGFDKPLDPREIGFHARHFWTGNYLSPSLHRLVRDWPWLLILAAPGLLSAVRGFLRTRAGAEPPPVLPGAPVHLFDGWGPMGPLPPLAHWFALWLVGLCWGSYLLFSKFAWIAAASLAVPAAIALADVPIRTAGRRHLGTALALCCALHGASILPGADRLWGAAETGDRTWSSPQVHPAWAFDELARALPGVVPEGEPVLASFVISPFILSYLDRPTLLHCFFEGDLLPRFERLTAARFDTEERYWTLLREEGARWLVVEAHTLLRDDPRLSDRYVAAQVEWPAGSAAVALHYAPERLNHFELAWQNPWFRIYRVLPEDQRPKHRAFAPAPMWSAPLFSAVIFDPWAGPTVSGSDPETRGLGSPAAGRTGAAPASLLWATLHADATTRARRLGGVPASGPLWESLERDCQVALETAPYHLDAWRCLSDAQQALGKTEAAARSRETETRWAQFLDGRGPPPSSPVPAAVDAR